MPPVIAERSDSLEKVLAVLKIRRWWILSATSVVTLAAIGIVLALPDRYKSEATLEMVQPVVSQRYVSETDTVSPADIVQSMKREVLSRTRLLAIIDEYKLYPEARAKAGPEDLTDLMRKDIDMEPIDVTPVRSEISAFRIAFSAEDPALAQSVTRRLTSLFIEEQLKNQASEAAMTTEFLSDQLSQAQRKLAEQEARRRAFQIQHGGELPEQEAANLAALADLRTQLQGVTDRIAKVQEERRSLERTLSDKLAGLESERTALLTQFTPRHPKVEQKQQEIARMSSLMNELKTGTGPASSLAVSDDPAVAGLIGQVDANAQEQSKLASDEGRIKKEIAQYESKVNLAPVREREMADVVRESDAYSQEVKDLQLKLSQARQTTRVAENQEGRRFRLVDGATLPTKPSSPPRLRVALGGLGGGLMIGLVLAFLADKRDATYHSEKDVTRHFQVPLVLGIPKVLTPGEIRMHTLKIGFEWIAAFILILAVAGAEYYMYRFN